jgi:hypothetical protein
MGPGLAGDHRCRLAPRLGQQPGDPLPIERRRHHQHPQVGPEVAAGVEGEGQPEVRLQAALVELVEDHQSHAFQAGITLQPPGEDALGHHLDASGGTDPPIVAGAIADGLADRLAQQGGHAAGRRPGGEPPGLEHDDRPAL